MVKTVHTQVIFLVWDIVHVNSCVIVVADTIATAEELLPRLSRLGGENPTRRTHTDGKEHDVAKHESCKARLHRWFAVSPRITLSGIGQLPPLIQS